MTRAQAMADFEQVRSPINGTITARNVEVGNLVAASGAAQGLAAVPAGSTGGPPTGGAQGGELFDVVDLPALKFCAVPEQDAPFVQAGQPVDLTFSELPGETFKGKVTRSSDSLSQQTRTLLAEVQIADAQHRLRPGMFASVQMHYKAPNPGILISGDSLLNTGARPVCTRGGERRHPNAARERRARPGYAGVRHRRTAGRRHRRGEPQRCGKEGAHVSTRPAPAGQQGGDAEQEKQRGQAKPE